MSDATCQRTITLNLLSASLTLKCQLHSHHSGPHRHNAPRNDDAGRMVLLWEGDENYESLDEWEDRLPPTDIGEILNAINTELRRNSTA